MKKDRRIIRLFALLLSLLTVLTVLAACGNDVGADTEGTSAPSVVTTASAAAESTEPPVTEPVPDLPDTMWNREFRILGCSENKSESYPSFELTAEEMTGETVNDAVFKRNETVKGKYGITVTQTLAQNTHNTITSNSAAGDDLFDLVFVYVNKVGGLAQKGSFLNMNDIQYIDFSKPWWNPNVNAETSIRGKVYYSSSDFALRDKNRVQLLIVNDELREDCKLDAVPELVRTGTWTAEKMAEYVTAGTADLNGDGKHEASDRYGLVMHSYNAFAALCFGCGIRLLDKDDDDLLIVSTNGEHDSDAVDKVLNICRKDISMTPEDYGRNWDINSDTFCDGRALFASTLVGSLGYYNQNSDFDFTVCPYPKFNEDQENYYTIPDVGCMLFAVPVTDKEPDFAGFALEALSYEATDTSYAAYIELMCKSRNVCNADSVEMMDLCFDNVVYDNGIFYSDNVTLYGIYNKTIPAANSNILLTTLTSMKKSVQSAIDKINDAFEG